MKKVYFYLIFIFSLLFYSANICAIDTYAKIARERPDNLNVKSIMPSSSRALNAQYLVDNEKIPLNKIHNWTIQLTHNYKRSLKGANITLAATMPEHMHGMTTKPIISQGNKEGEFIIEGMNFHMPGWWELTLDVDGYGSRDLIIFNVIVGEDMPEMHHNHESH